MYKTAKLLLTAAGAVGLLLSTGCKTGAPKPSGFLSDYGHLQRVNDSTWRYVDATHLGAFQTFTIPPVEVVVKAYWAGGSGADQRQAVGSLFRQKIVNALAGHYEVVGAAGPGTPEIRVAITQAYRVGNSLALGVEAEIVDRQSHQQLAAVRGIRIGPPDVGFRLGYHNPDAGGYMAAWWTLPSAVELMQEWADQIRGLIEEAHRK